MDTQAVITVIVLVLLGFLSFCIYFIFKILQFVIQAINLYKDMVTRQDVMIKLLKGISNKSMPYSNNNPKEQMSNTYERYKKINPKNISFSTTEQIIYDQYLRLKANHAESFQFDEMVDEIVQNTGIKDKTQIINVLRMVGEEGISAVNT